MNFKHLLSISLLTLSCATPPLTHSPHEFPPPNDIPLVYGNNNSTYWICSVDDVNDALVWVSCSFRNTSPFKKQTCVSVSFKSNCLSTFSDRDISTGWLEHDQAIEGYAAFTEKRRKELTSICGPKLEGCKLSVVETKCAQ